MTLSEVQRRGFERTGLTLSRHAVERAYERFPKVDVVKELARAKSYPRKMTKKRMNTIKRDCSGHAWSMKITDYLISPNDIVFVVVNKLVVTVFVLDSK